MKLDTTRNDPLADGLDRLVTRDGFTRVDAATVEAFAAAPESSVTLLTDQLVRSPETWDMIIVLPEALRASGTGIVAAVAAPDASREIAATFGITVFPALLFQRAGQYLGAVEGMRDWLPLVALMRDMAAAPAARRPGVGIPVRRADSSTCH